MEKGYKQPAYVFSLASIVHKLVLRNKHVYNASNQHTI